MSKEKKPLFSDEELTDLAQEINEQYGNDEQQDEVISDSNEMKSEI
ncbi:bacitracin ABC transporter ATP-binding protein [Fictibacillus sp. NPDC058756]